MKKRISPEEYDTKFKGMMDAHEPVTDKTRHQITINPSETFVQCYSATDKPRSELPHYWFIGNYGTLISVYGNQLYKVTAYINRNGYLQHKFRKVLENGQTAIKNVQLQNLVALCFGRRTKAADAILQQLGLYAFKYLSGHHQNAHKTDNRADNVIIVVGKFHRSVHSLRASIDISERIPPKEYRAFQKFSRTSDEAVVVVCGQNGERIVRSLENMVIEIPGLGKLVTLDGVTYPVEQV